MQYVVRETIDEYYDEEYEELVRVEDDGTEFVVFGDGVEPEDALLRRSLASFVSELERNASEINRLRAEVRAQRH